MTMGQRMATGRAVRALRSTLRGPEQELGANGADGASGAPVERCEMCAQPIPDQHSHVVNLDSRELLCTCRPCSFLFVSEGAAGGRYQAVPERFLSFDDFTLDQARWDALRLPVGMAFFFRNSRLDRTTAFYPSPAGATESELTLEAWDDVLADNPGLRDAAPDVEALLIVSSGAEVLGAPGSAGGPGTPTSTDAGEAGSGFECFLVPIDACYELVGHLRRSWRGFDGGQEARDRLERFFTDLRNRCRPAPAASTTSAPVPSPRGPT